jgi:hypothetical protein
MNSLRRMSAVLFLCSVMSFPRSFIAFKLVCLAVFVFVHIADYRWNRHFRINTRILIFYCCVAIGGMVWSLVGLAGTGETMGALDSLRLYVAWSMAYFLILTLLRNDDGMRYLHTAIVISGLLIAVINFYGMYDQYAEIGLFSEAVRKELSLAVGFHEGYVQITSHNIGSLLFITPYLLTLQFCGNTRELNGKWTKLSLLACVLLSAFSGRRALWLCVAMTPLLVGLLAISSNTWQSIRPLARKMIGLMAAGCAFGVILLVVNSAHPGETGYATLDHLSAAFSAEDERTIQGGYLLSSFMDQPLFGSGFGAYGGYLRSDDRPWLYELTYFQLLYNCGLVGFLYWTFLGGAYLFLAGRVIREQSGHTGQPLCLIVALFTFLLGAYSNPYLGSFDFLIFVSVLPFVASLRGDTRPVHAVARGRMIGVERRGGLNLGT